MRAGPGASPLPPNLWLQEQIAKLDPNVRPTVLYHAWRNRHADYRGWELADPQRAFRDAVKRCYRRLARQRKG